MDGFTTFGTAHLVMLGVAAVGLVPAVLVGRTRPDEAARRRTSRVLAVVLVVVLVPLQTLGFLGGRYDVATTLPLQLCDLASVAAVVALWTHHRYAVGLTYYWGLLMTTQGLLTPALDTGFPSVAFVGFWALHLLVVWSAVHLTWGVGLPPTWREYGTTVATTLVWAGAVHLFNDAAGTNYGFLERKPEGSVLDVLAPWPTYLAQLAVIVLVLWALMTLPWTVVRRRRSRQSA